MSDLAADLGLHRPLVAPHSFTSVDATTLVKMAASPESYEVLDSSEQSGSECSGPSRRMTTPSKRTNTPPEMRKSPKIERNPKKLTKQLIRVFDTAKTRKLIELVEGYPWLYNKFSGVHRGQYMRTNAWAAIAKSLGLEQEYAPQACKLKWCNLKDYFLRELAKVKRSQRSGCGAANVYTSRWKYFASCSFLSGKANVSCRSHPEASEEEMTNCSSQPRDCSEDESAPRQAAENRLPEFQPSPAYLAAMRAEMGAAPPPSQEPTERPPAAALQTPGPQSRKRKHSGSAGQCIPIEQALRAAAANLRPSCCPPEHQDEIGHALLGLRMYIRHFDAERRLGFFQTVTNYAHEEALAQFRKDREDKEEREKSRMERIEVTEREERKRQENAERGEQQKRERAERESQAREERIDAPFLRARAFSSE
ncbi:uncharacterized protein LOC120851102 isoform X1 [Ixodes scapularis]|uniref:uncharacterized protein LOC120851102 isoform X1 n=1 Tax=Ixodes scapularis TaxID=6945 RepID=UPI001A9EADF1|nr:uncharacterized protein LOC120851102 isoform X1 [Ixodes scapularis]